MNSNNNEVIEEQYLFFTIDNDTYAISSNFVKEIVDYVSVTRIPKSNNAIKGVTNIRGDIIAVIDPRVRFKMEPATIGKRTSLIIVEFFDKARDKKIVASIVVDFVSEVDIIAKESLLPTPQFGTKIDKKYIDGIIKTENEYISILDIEQLLNLKELSKVS